MTAPVTIGSADLLSTATATCRDCGASFPFPEIDRLFVHDSDGFVRCRRCASGPDADRESMMDCYQFGRVG